MGVSTSTWSQRRFEGGFVAHRITFEVGDKPVSGSFLKSVPFADSREEDEKSIRLDRSTLNSLQLQIRGCREVLNRM